MFRKALITIVIVILGAMAVSAQQETPNDPTTNEDANACYAGGSLEGKCHGDINHNGIPDEVYEVNWAWYCGWYIIRHDYGLISESQIPETCGGLLPKVEVSGPVVNCAVDLSEFEGEGFDIWFSGPDGTIGDGSSEFLHWSPTNEGYPPCKFAQQPT